MRPMKKTLSVLALLSLACGGLGADDPVTEHPDAVGLCEGGLESTPTWQGEYPGPVVHVMQSATLPYRALPCGPIAGQCVVSPGLYHPWGRAATGFATVRPVLKYRLSRDFTDSEGIAYREGDIVEVTAYLGEGFCAFRINGREESGECPGMFDESASAFVALNPEAENLPETQLFQTRCEDGTSAWIDAAVALAADGVEEGVITGYGEVAPHGTADGF